MFSIDSSNNKTRVNVVTGQVIRQQTVRSDMRLPAGRYKFEITARNGYWEEFLTLTTMGGVTHQSIMVIRDGKSLYQDEVNFY